jgi:hypothetical protein
MTTEIRALIKAGGIAIALFPDSRNYAQFSILVQKDEMYLPISAQDFCVEYLPDLFNATVATMKWLSANCDEVAHEGRHLYFAFKE